MRKSVWIIIFLFTLSLTLIVLNLISPKKKALVGPQEPAVTEKVQ